MLIISIHKSQGPSHMEGNLFHMFAKLRIYFHIEQSEKRKPEICFFFLLQIQAKRTRKQEQAFEVRLGATKYTSKKANANKKRIANKF